MSIAEKKWTPPAWMVPYLQHITNTGGGDPVEMFNGDTSPLINLPVSTLQACVKSQISLLYRLHKKGLLK